MKKIYAAMAIAMTVSAGASAAGFQYKGEVRQAIAPSKDFTTVENANGGMHKAPTAPREGVTPYSWTYYTAYSTDEGTVSEWVLNTVTVEINGSKALINGFMDLAPIEATYDASTQTLTIPEQDLFYTVEGGEKTHLFTYELVPSEDDPEVLDRKKVKSLSMKFVPAGVDLQLGDDVMHLADGGYATDTSAYMMISTASLEPQGRGYLFIRMSFFTDVENTWPECQTFEFNEAEWADVGTAKLKEGWLAPLFESDFPECDVTCMQSRTNPGRVLLVDPYNAVFNGELQLPKGYIELDVSNPDLVYVMPFVFSGVQMANFGSDIPLGNFFFMTNSEAMAVLVDGKAVEDVIADAQDFGEELATYKDGVVTIPQCRVQVPSSLDQAGIWSTMWSGAFNDPKNPFDDERMVATIKLPELASVEGILDDVDNAPKRFFNLQGVRSEERV